MIKKVQEQQVAVFGASGSGKTVLLSSFYGAYQEPQHANKDLFNVVADSVTDGTRLHKNYLGLKEDKVPPANRFQSTSHSFSVKLKSPPAGKSGNAHSVDALKLLWHDYPGEWFEQDVDGEEAQRRLTTFKDLLGSDVALILVDGQKLIDRPGVEEAYLKSLFTMFHNGLLTLKDGLLEDGKPLVRFPRIWVLALSKADLLPDMTVQKFRDLVIAKGGDELNQLRDLLATMVNGTDALAVGEDFVLLSSAKFEAGEIEVSQRIGLDLVLPIAAMLPFERHVRWAKNFELPNKVVQNLLEDTDLIAQAIKGIGWLAKFLPNRLGALISSVTPAAAEAVTIAGTQLKEAHSKALAKNDYFAAALTRFGMNLEQGEQQNVLLRSER